MKRYAIASLFLLAACGGSAPQAADDESLAAPGCASLFSAWRQVAFTPATIDSVAITPLTLTGATFGAGQALTFGPCSYIVDIEAADAGIHRKGSITLSDANPATAPCVANAIPSTYVLYCKALIVLSQNGSTTYTTP